jgi:4-amino-4-deoxy-L-arabinose transferase-like glycosyltransferase
MRRLFPAAACAALTALYVARLDFSPVYLINDEVNSGLQAYSLATTGRGTSGERLPVYFAEPEFPAGRDPMSIYATALLLKVVPLSETSVRLPSAIAGIVGVLLMYAAALSLFGNVRAALAAAALLALAPAYFILSRIGLPPVWPVPFMLGWLWALATFSSSRQPWRLWLGSFLLGLSGLSYLGAAAVAPFFVGGTLLWLYRIGETRPRCYALVLAGFAVPLLLVAYAVLQHPSRFADLFQYYGGEAASRMADAGERAASERSLTSFLAWQHRISTYWNYFNPTFLFIAGDDSPRYSTGHVGVFLLPFAILIPLGVRRISAATRESRLGWLIAGLFFCTPIVASLQSDLQIKRVLPIVPFGVLLAVAGFDALSRSDRRWIRTTATVLAVAIPLQFAAFMADYYTRYRLKSGAWRSGNLRGALTQVIHDAGPGRAVYLSSKIPNARIYWRFYAIAENAPTLVDHPVVLDTTPANLAHMPSHSLLVAYTDEVRGPAAADWRVAARIYELDGPTFFSIYERR